MNEKLIKKCINVLRDFILTCGDEDVQLLFYNSTNYNQGIKFKFSKSMEHNLFGNIRILLTKIPLKIK